MDAAAVHAQQQQHQNPTTAANANITGNIVGSLSGGQVMMNSLHSQVHSHHNHTNRGPHKKRTASNAALDDNSADTRSVAARTHHLINGGGVLRMPMMGANAVTSVSDASSSIVSSTSTSGGKSKGNSSTSSKSGGSVTPNSNTNAPNGPLTEEEKKAERRAANRRSAFQSRQRRKILIEDLQRTVAALSKDNNDLRKNNDEIRSQLEAALLENRQLRQISSSLSAQAHAQQAQQVAAQKVQQQHQQQAAPVGQQQQASGSPAMSAQQANAPVPSLPQHQLSQAVPVAPNPPPPFPQALSSSTAALTNFLTNLSSQGAGAPSSSDQQQHIFNAKIALMAAQSRVSELEHHQAAQAQAAANAAVAHQHQHQAQLQAQAAANAALGFASNGASANSGLSDTQQLVRLQELLARGISNASAATAAPVSAAAPPLIAAANGNATTSNTSISAAGVDLTHLRNLLEAQQQQQHQAVGAVQAPGQIPTTPESPARSSVQEQVVRSPKTEAGTTTNGQSVANPEIVAGSNNGAVGPVAPLGSTSAIPTTHTSAGSSCVRSIAPSTLSATTSKDAPGIQLLIESLRAGQSGATGTPPLDEAVRNYIQHQQMAQQQQQQQAQSTAASIKAESS